MFTKVLDFLTNNITVTFLILALITLVLGIIYNLGLNPSDKSIQKIIQKFTVEDYSISSYAAERYLSWFHMKTYFVMLDYLLTLIGMMASLMTVFYASQSGNNGNKIIVFLSLLSTYFTIGNIFIKPNTLSNMSQHTWRALETCIVKTIHMKELSSNAKDILINDKISELEKYIENFEH